MTESLKILIVDDDDKNRKFFRVLLNKSGYVTVEAKDGKEAVRFAKTNYPDLILMDIQMPVMDGLTALKLIKTDPKTANIPVIAITSYAMQSDIERFSKEGFDFYITKPVRIKILLDTIKKISGDVYVR